MQKLKLTIEFVPASSWGQNLREILGRSRWNKIRNLILKKFKKKCAICRANGRLQAHEVWSYDDQKHIQKLENIIPLCNKCHSVKHLGFASIQFSQTNKNPEILIRHFMKVNKCSRKAFQNYLKEAFEKFEKRSRFEWSLDLSFLKRLSL